MRCISSDCDTILAGGDDSVVMLFDKLTSLSLASFPAHESSVSFRITLVAFVQFVYLSSLPLTQWMCVNFALI